MTKVSFVDKFIKSGSVPIHFVCGKDTKGRDCYYFVMCSYEKIKMLQDINEGIFDVNDYGKIIASGFGKTPSEEVKNTLKKEYNFDTDFLK